MQCVEGCGDCCGVVPATVGELRAVEQYARANGVRPVEQGLTCPFFQRGKCQVYPVRPRICQAFGHDAGRLECLHGRNVNVDSRKLRAWVLDLGMPAGTLHGLLPRFEALP